MHRHIVARHVEAKNCVFERCIRNVTHVCSNYVTELNAERGELWQPWGAEGSNLPTGSTQVASAVRTVP